MGRTVGPHTLGGCGAFRITCQLHTNRENRKDGGNRVSVNRKGLLLKLTLDAVRIGTLVVVRFGTLVVHFGTTSEAKDATDEEE